jgi:hypothetical protein
MSVVVDFYPMRQTRFFRGRVRCSRLRVMGRPVDESRQRWTSVDKLPEAGALAIVAFPKPRKEAGFPARVFAILP